MTWKSNQNMTPTFPPNLEKNVEKELNSKHLPGFDVLKSGVDSSFSLFGIFFKEIRNSHYFPEAFLEIEEKVGRSQNIFVSCLLCCCA